MIAIRHIGPALIFVAIVLMWQLLHLVGGANTISSPAATAHKVFVLAQTADFWDNVAATAYAFGIALVIGILFGAALGIALGISPLSSAVAEPVLINLYSIPKVTLYPLVLLCFGLGPAAKVAFGVMHGMIPIIIFTMNAIRQMKPVYLRSARVMHLTSLQAATTVVLPAVVPEMLAGVRLGFSLTLLGVLIGEMFASRKGLGFLITNAMNFGDMDTIMAVAFVLSVFAIFANWILLRVSDAWQ